MIIRYRDVSLNEYSFACVPFHIEVENVVLPSDRISSFIYVKLIKSTNKYPVYQSEVIEVPSGKGTDLYVRADHSIAFSNLSVLPEVFKV